MAEHKYSLGLVGDGYSVSENGIIRIFKDQVYFCDRNIVDIAREFEGRWIEIAFCDPKPSAAIPIDEKIAPLVAALQARGIVTLSSCEGHMIDGRVPYPFVGFYAPGTLDWGSFPIADGWNLVKHSTNVWRLRTIKEASSEAELAGLHGTIKDQLAALL